MGEIILRRIGDNFYAEPSSLSSPQKVIEAKIDPPTVIGRGPVLKCPDKKVSRNHATIDWDDDGVLITSTHVNPTFVIINGKEQTLSQGQSTVLNNGDAFGLLKDAYWYKVVLKSLHSSLSEKVVKDLTAAEDLCPPSKDISDCDDINNLNNQEEESKVIIAEAPYSNESSNILSNDHVADSNKSENDTEQKGKMDDDESDSIPEVFSSGSNRERVLPKWLRNIKGGRNSEPVSTKTPGAVHGEKQKKVRISKPPSSKPSPARSRKLHESSDNSEDDQKDSPRKGAKARKRSPQKPKEAKKPNQYHSLSQDFDTPDPDTQIRVQNVPKSKAAAGKASAGSAGGKDLHSVSDDDDDIQSKSRDKATKDYGQKNPKRNVHTSNDQKILGAETKKGAKPPRKSCQYGEQCYRKTPKHRKEMAHPGDDDYVSHDESADEDNDDDDDGDKPECEYGVNCYRKNPQHRQSFKHTKKPQPARNTKRKAKREGYEDDDDDDSENEYDFDDPFLNDESTDDYAPTDSSGRDSDIEDAAEEDDTERMMKEAKKFVKKRKH